jgi:hypothetical protein
LKLMRPFTFLDHVIRRYLLQRARATAHARDLERINAAADQLNAEADEVMEYQSFSTSQSW